MSPFIYITVFTVIEGNATKTFIDVNGLPHKDNSVVPYMSRGKSQTVAIKNLSELATVFQSLSVTQCLGYGIFNGDCTDLSEHRIVAKKHLKFYSDRISRTADNFLYPHGKAIAYFDFDSDAIDKYKEKTGITLTPEVAVELLKNIIPELVNVQFLARYSVSSCFKSKANNDWIIPPKSFHLYFAVNDGQNIPLLKEYMMIKLWLAGHGYIQLSKPSSRDGVQSRLVRCLIDCAVFEAPRIDFAGGAQIATDAPFYQDLIQPVLIGKEGELHIENLASISEKEKAKFHRICAAEKGIYKKEVVKNLKEKIRKQHPQLSENEMQTESERILKLHTNNILTDDDKIYFSSGNVYTVREIFLLAIGKKEHPLDGEHCADPNEPDYNGGVCAHFNWNTGKPNIYSHAHGGRLFTIKLIQGITMTEYNQTENQTEDNNIHRVQVKSQATSPAIKQSKIDIDLNDDLSDQIDTAMTTFLEFNQRNPLFFTNNSMVVRINTLDDDDWFIEKADLNAFQTALFQVVRFVEIKWSRKTERLPPRNLIDAIFSKLKESRLLPKLKRIIHVPQYTEEGILIKKNGYDASSGLYLKTEIELPEIPDPSDELCNYLDPTMFDIETALKVINTNIFCDFQFKTNADKANAYALLILPFIRLMVKGNTPLHYVEAASPGAGKSLLVESIMQIFDKRVRITSYDPKQSPDELAQSLFSAMGSPSAFFALDNVVGDFKSSIFDAVLTTGYYEKRMMYSQELKGRENKLVYIMTGNNCSLSPDTVRRTIPIGLDSKSENPAQEKRAFTHRDLKNHLRDKQIRTQVIKAIITCVEYWKSQGKPMPPVTMPNMGSYEYWRDTMGGILHTINIGDYHMDEFIENLDSLYEKNLTDEKQESIFVTEEWYKRHPNQWVNIRPLAEIIKEAYDTAGIPIHSSYWFRGSKENQNPIDVILGRIGRLLTQKDGQVYGKIKIRKAANKKRQVVYMVHDVDIDVKDLPKPYQEYEHEVEHEDV